jgi:hypothetical protein
MGYTTALELYSNPSSVDSISSPSYSLPSSSSSPSLSSSSPPSPLEEDEGYGVKLKDGDEGDGSW